MITCQSSLSFLLDIAHAPAMSLSVILHSSRKPLVLGKDPRRPPLTLRNPTSLGTQKTRRTTSDHIWRSEPVGQGRRVVFDRSRCERSETKAELRKSSLFVVAMTTVWLSWYFSESCLPGCGECPSFLVRAGITKSSRSTSRESSPRG